MDLGVEGNGFYFMTTKYAVERESQPHVDKSTQLATKSSPSIGTEVGEGLEADRRE